MKRIDEELQNGTLDPRRYLSESERDSFKFLYFSDFYLQKQELRLERGEIAPYTFDGKKRLVNNHLKPFFGEVELVSIQKRLMQEFYDTYTSKFRTRDLAIQEMRVILNFALDNEYINALPRFPKTSSSGKTDGESIISIELQEKIINEISDPLYRSMVKVLAIYMLRPSEIRALKVGDIDFDKGELVIQRHFSMGKLIKGRKSDKRRKEGISHRLPIVDTFLEILDEINFGEDWDDDQFLFKGKTKPYVGTKALSNSWREACKKLEIKGVNLYQGTKHAGLSHLVRNGVNEAIAMKISGHSSTASFRRYAQPKVIDLKKYLETLKC